MSNSTTIQPTNRYEGAGRGRRLASWNTPSSGPVATTTPAIATLRNRARDLARNDPVAAAAIRVQVNSLIGFGIQCRTKSDDRDSKKRISAVWDKWVSRASNCGLDLYGLEVLIARALATEGEAFIRLRPRRPDTVDGVPFQLEPLEADMVPLLTTQVHPGLPPGSQIVQGIEIDGNGDRAAIWFHPAHPGEHLDIFNLTNNPAANLVRVPIESVLHIYEPQRIGQMRGITPFSPVITKLKNVADYDDAVIEKVKLSNLFTAFLTRPLASGAADAMTGLPFDGDPAAPLAGLEPGTLQELLPGESMQFSDPPDAGAGYVEFMRQQYLTIASALGVPPEMLTQELRDISDRTLRFSVSEYRRRIEQIVWTVLVPKMLNPIREAFCLYARLSGQLSEADYQNALSFTWSMHAQPNFHPSQDVIARIKEVEAGFRSRTSVISERGEDPDAVDLERAEDLQRSVDLGLQPLSDQQTAVEIEQQRYNLDQGNAASAKASAALEAIALESRESVEILNQLVSQQPELTVVRDAKTETLPSIMRGFLGKSAR